MTQHLTPAVAAALRSLLDRADGVVDDALTAVEQQSPVFFERVDLDDYRRYAQLLLVGVLVAILDDEPASPALLEKVRETMAARAEAGLSLEDSLSAFAFARSAVWSMLHAELGGFTFAEVEPVRERADRWSNAVQLAAARGYADQSAVWSDARTRRARRLVDQLLDGTFDEHGAEAVRDLLGDGPLRVVVGGPPPDSRSVVAGQRHGTTLRVQRADEPLPEGACGVSRPHPAEDLAAAHREAVAAEALAGSAPLLFEDADLWVVADAAGWVVEPWLVDDEEGDGLVDAVVTWLRAGRSLQGAAEQLHVHANTVLRRVHRLEELTGLDLADPGDQTRFWLAVQLRRGRAGAGTPHETG